MATAGKFVYNHLGAFSRLKTGDKRLSSLTSALYMFMKTFVKKRSKRSFILR